jgi:hypothetical protein
MKPSGIEPATFRFAAQHLNHCATAKIPFLRTADTQIKRSTQELEMNHVAVSQAAVSRHFPVCSTRPASGEWSDFALHNYCGIKSGAGDGRISQQKTRLWPPRGHHLARSWWDLVFFPYKRLQHFKVACPSCLSNIRHKIPRTEDGTFKQECAVL